MSKIIKNTIKLLLSPILSNIMKRYSWYTFRLWQIANKIEFSPLVTKKSVLFSHAKLTLNESSPLYTESAKKLYVNVDEIIFPQIITHQEWSTNNNKTLLSYLRGEKIGLIDVGANVGLFTRQMLIASKKISHAYCFEPKISNFELAAANLKSFTNVSLFNFGLADENKTIDVNIDFTNSGNISLNKKAILNTVYGTEKIKIRCPDVSKEPFATIITNHNSLAYKSDTQGLDEIIFTHLGTHLWKKIECAMIEIYRIPDKKIDYENMNEIFKAHFSKIYSINKNSFLEFSEYVTYSNGTDGTFDDILFIK
jgi:FkbM family methyltransferase